MYKIPNKFIVFQSIFGVISLVLIFISADSFYELSYQKFIYNIDSRLWTIVWFGPSIIVSIICNIVHQYNISKLKNSNLPFIFMIVNTVLCYLSLPLLSIFTFFSGVEGLYYLQACVILMINSTLYIPQLVLMNRRNKMIINLVYNKTPYITYK